MVKESYAHAIEDMTAHRLIDVRNEAARVLTAIEKSLARAGAALTAEQRKAIDSAAAALKAKIEHCDDPDELYAAMTAANDAAAPLTEAQMDEVLRKTVKGRKLEEF